MAAPAGLFVGMFLFRPLAFSFFFACQVLYSDVDFKIKKAKSKYSAFL